ncbi:calcium-activated potassium channel subunit alpha-1 [Planoprotostelium fungivorum]|uniref:Calcium-activated potassium channel subunit alpha-1 n=1 Tax=Planoprotostelium fungivorum TaxID=1890364 RepID=A0A2P6NW48_9EUKA|nr:calcium-activated potassium channel subunit alpha-1 [Planoprotostelium fungivorum]
MGIIPFTNALLVDQLIFFCLAAAIMLSFLSIWFIVKHMNRRTRGHPMDRVYDVFQFYYFVFQGSFFGVFAQILSALICLTSVCIFLYFVSQITNMAPNTTSSDSPGYVDTDGVAPGANDQLIQQLFQNRYLLWTEFSFGVYFMVRAIFRFLLAPSKLIFFLNALLWCDLATALAGLSGPFLGYYYYGVQFLRFAMLHETTSYVLDTYGNALGSLSRNALRLIFLLSCLLFGTASFLFVLENPTVVEGGKVANFLDGLYLAMATLSTVGYGDVTPLTSSGKIAIMIALAIAIGVVPWQARLLLDQIIERSSPFYAFYHGRDHAVLVSQSARPVLPFLKEFYGPERMNESVKMCVLLGDADVSRELEIFVKQPHYSLLVSILLGNPLQEKDMARCRMEHAAICFVLSDDSRMESSDPNTSLKVSAVRRHNPDVRIFTQIVSNRNRPPIEDRDVTDILTTNAIRMGILSQAVINPGYAAVLCNALSTPIIPKNLHGLSLWEQQYVSGLRTETRRVSDMSAYEGMTCQEAVKRIYREHGAILLGLAGEGRKNVVISSDDVIREGDCGLLWSHKKKLKFVSVRTRSVLRSLSPSMIETTDLPLHLSRQLPSSPADSDNEGDDNILGNFTESKTIAEAIIESTSRMNINSHFLVCGLNFEEMAGFVVKLRSYASVSQVPIVILSKEIPNALQWRAIASLPMIWFIHGDPTHRQDLERAGAVAAIKTVIFGLDGPQNKTDLSSDAGCIMAFQLLEKASHQPIVALSHSANSRFLENQQWMHRHKGFPQLTNPFQSGQVFSSSILDAILAQSFENPDLIPFLEELVDELSVIIPIQAHYPQLVGQRYRVSFDTLIEAEQPLISLGVYRQHRRETNDRPLSGRGVVGSNNSRTRRMKRTRTEKYVLTNPHGDLILLETDEIVAIHLYEGQQKKRGCE